MSMLDNFMGNPTMGTGYGSIANKAMAQYSAPQISSFGSILSNGLSNLNNFYNNNRGIIDFGLTGLSSFGDWYQQDKQADAAKKMYGDYRADIQENKDRRNLMDTRIDSVWG